ncbi:Speckle-type POZ protein [Pelomyxa schiedti]|nr:Speckle-type POZ protein [Pelomyxa schiedti]
MSYSASPIVSASPTSSSPSYSSYSSSGSGSLFAVCSDRDGKDCDCVLEVASVDGAFTCAIKKYSMIAQPYFYTPAFDAAGERWKMQCYPRGCGGENQGFCGWYLYYLGTEDRIKVTYSIELRSGNASLACKNEHAAVVFGRKSDDSQRISTAWGLAQIVRADDLLPRLVDDTLTVHLRLTVITETLNTVALHTPVADTLADDMAALLKSGFGADIRFNVRGRRFSAHKGILYARSPVMKAMLDSGMKEATTGEVAIEEVEPDVFQELLYFMYSGRVSSSSVYETQGISLLLTADRYDIPGLRGCCENRLASTLTADNVYDRLAAAMQCPTAVGLRRRCMLFLSDNADQLFTSSQFKQLSADVLQEIVAVCARRKRSGAPTNTGERVASSSSSSS